MGVPLRAEMRRRDSNLIAHRVGYVLVIRKVAFNCHRDSIFDFSSSSGARVPCPSPVEVGPSTRARVGALLGVVERC